MTMGHAITGGWFYNIDIEPIRGGPRPREVFAAAIRFKKNLLSEPQLVDELTHLLDELWDW
jgi:hypothetical protein